MDTRAGRVGAGHDFRVIITIRCSRTGPEDRAGRVCTRKTSGKVDSGAAVPCGSRTETARKPLGEPHSFGPSSAQLVQGVGCPLYSLPVGILHHVRVDLERGCGIGAAPLPLCHPWRSAAFKQHACMFRKARKPARGMPSLSRSGGP